MNPVQAVEDDILTIGSPREGLKAEPRYSRKRKNSKKGTPAKVACVLIDHFALRQEAMRNPGLKSIPSIIYCSHGSKQYVLDYSPQLQGVHRNMPLQEALSRARSANLIEADMPHYEQAFERVLDSLEGRSPIVEPAELGCAYVGLQGLEGMYRGEARMISAILSLPPEGDGARIGVAKGKFPAYLAARRAAVNQAFRAPDDIKGFLEKLPVEVLPVSWALKERLHVFGLHTLGQIASLAPGPLTSQFGPVGRRIWELSNGIDKTEILLRKKEEEVVESMSFPDPVSTIEPVLMAIETLLRRAFSSPRVRGRQARVSTLEGRTMRGPRWTHRMVFREPVASAEQGLALIKGSLASRVLPGPLEDLSLILSGISRETGRQINLFPKVRQRDRLRDSVRQLEARLGCKAPIFQLREVEPWSRIPERREALVRYAL